MSFSTPFSLTEEVGLGDGGVRRRKRGFKDVEVEEEEKEEEPMKGKREESAAMKGKREESADMKTRRGLEEVEVEEVEEMAEVNSGTKEWDSNVTGKTEDTKKKFEEVTERLWGKREQRKKPPKELMAETRPSNEPWMQENELMQCLKLLRGEITTPELQRRKAFFKYWDENENPANKNPEPTPKKPENRKRGPGATAKPEEKVKQSGSSFDKILRDVEKNKNKPGKKEKEGPTVSWKMFFYMFIFYFLMGFKGIIWNYFFPSAKSKK